jgi:hypothetical protein
MSTTPLRAFALVQNGRTLAALFHGGWDTIIVAILFWFSSFVVLFLVVSGF